MNDRIISSHRYKKVTRDELKRNNAKNANLNKVRNHKKEKTKTKKNIYIPKIFKIIAAVLFLVLIGFLSKLVIRYENFNILSVFSNKDVKVALEQNYNFKIGVSKLDSTNKLATRNIILNELLNMTTSNLIRINKDYAIEYKGAVKVEKINNKEYFVELAPEYDIEVEDIINSVAAITSAGETNIYYNRVNKIDKIESLGQNNIKFILKQEDPYFIYCLNFPIYKSKNTEYTLEATLDSSVVLKKNTSKSTLDTITLYNYFDSSQMVSDFRDEKIDSFVVSSDATMQLIGKHEYNIKKYRDGETIFLLGNKESSLFNIKEVRQAIVYSLNREEIVKEINSSFAEVIDLPFIYSSNKYKYDIYGAANLLLSNGWSKVSGVYTKNINGENVPLELNMLVNSSDQTKMKIAEKIKEMLEANGIKLNILSGNENYINSLKNNSNYDIILTTVYINDSPDITFLEEYINLNEKTNEAFEHVKKSNTYDIASNIQNLQNVLSEEVACIGILARNANVVYQKNIVMQNENIGYMKVFENIESIGKKKGE